MRLVCEERTELTTIVQTQQKDIAALQQAGAQNKVWIYNFFYKIMYGLDIILLRIHTKSFRKS